MILQSAAYKNNGALFIIWDEAEDTGEFADGPIPMFLLSPLAKGAGKTSYSNSIHYTHSSTLKTIQEIFNVRTLVGRRSESEDSRSERPVPISSGFVERVIFTSVFRRSSSAGRRTLPHRALLIEA